MSCLAHGHRFVAEPPRHFAGALSSAAWIAEKVDFLNGISPVA
jgi:hypothetical protein